MSTRPIDEQSGEQLAAVSEGLVGLHREFYGKGPERTKTFAVNDTILCMLYGGFTATEQTLITEGEGAEVESLRHRVQSTMRKRSVAVVEEAVGRKVVAYMSQANTDPDIAVELFILEPQPEPLRGEHEL